MREAAERGRHNRKQLRPTRLLASVCLACLAAPASPDPQELHAVVARPEFTGHKAPLSGELLQSNPWFTVDKYVSRQLLTRDVGEWAAELDAARLPAPVDQLVAFNVLVRAGHYGRLPGAIDRLAELRPSLSPNLQSKAANFLLELAPVDLSRRVLERFPEAEPGLALRFVERWASEGDPAEVDRWLKARPPSKTEHWLHTRLRFRKKLGTADELMAELGGRVRAEPATLAVVLTYLNAAKVLGTENVDVSWLPEVSRPVHMIECQELAGNVAFEPAVAVFFYERALGLDFTEHDQAAMARRMMMRALIDEPDPPTWEDVLRSWSQHGLMAAYGRVGEADKAQALLESLTAEEKRLLDLVNFTRTAGQIQKASGARVVESRIHEAEKERAEDTRYWLGRAGYYVGRGESDEAVTAFQRAHATAATVGERAAAIYEHTFYLFHSQGRAAAVELLWQFLEQADPASRDARLIVRELSDYENDETGFLRPEDERLWAYLAAQELWQFTPERELLQEMARNAHRAGRLKQFYVRLEGLARVPGADPSKLRYFALNLMRWNRVSRAVPVLEEALELTPDNPDRLFLLSALRDAHLGLGHWRTAEEFLLRTDPSSQGLRLGLERLAITAARAGAREEALRFWKQRANLYRPHPAGLEMMASLGLEDRLRELYEGLEQRDPRFAGVSHPE